MAARQQKPTKLTAPVLPRIYARDRLYRRLDELRDRPVVWITAPAGAGKTTLVAAYLRDRDIQPLWYRLDPGDSDIGSFFYYLGEGLKRLNRSRRRLLPVLAPEYRAGPAAFARRFFRELFATMKAPGVLVLDNMEAVTDDAAFDEILRHGMEEIPPGRQVIVTSRNPPAALHARAMAGGRLARLDWPELQLTHDEGRALVRFLAGDRPLPDEAITRLQETACGWITGLVLQFQAMPSDDAQAPARRGAAEPGVDLSRRRFAAYFATEIFHRLPGKTRTLLLKTAWFTPVHPGAAARLTGIRDAGARLEWLARQQLFVTRLAVGRPAYVYHPLLRAFLLDRAEAELSPAEQRALKHRAARHLEEAGEADEAARLYRETACWEALARMIRSRAAEMLAQGRHHRLHEWLAALPRLHLEGDPWLGYWLGSAALAFDPGTAGTHFRAAYHCFVSDGDGDGACLAWLGVMDSIMFTNDSLAEIPRWLTELEHLRRRFGTRPDPALEGRVAFTAFNMGFTACPGSRDPVEWADTAERLRRLLPAIADDTARCLAAAHLAMYFTWHPQPARLKLLADMLLPYATGERVAPLARVIAYLVEITRRWNTGETTGTIELIDDALAVVENHGITIGRLWLLSAAIIYHLTRQDTGRAADLLAQYRRHIQPGNRHEQVHYDYLAGWLAWLEQDPERAREHTRRAWTDIRELHTPHFELLSGCAHAFMLIETARHAEAQALIDDTRRLATACHSRSVEVFHLGLLEAWSAWRRGETETCLARLRPALACGREMDLQVTLWHLPPVLARLCAVALEHDIETDYVRRFIRRNALSRPTDVELLSGWPVAVRIRTLGRFAVERDGQPIDPADRGHRKPLKLLKVLIALGGRQVPATQIEDILWPEAEGGDARRALITTLQRLRKLLGSRDLLRLDGGRLSLDAGQVWLDTWALETGLAAHHPDRIDQALHLYQGAFLPEEGDPPWLLAARVRLHDDVLQGYERLGRTLAERDAWRELIDLYRRGLKIDDLHEPFYRELMRAHGHLGQQAEAVRLYHRCRRRLHDALNLPPSPATRALFETLGPKP